MVNPILVALDFPELAAAHDLAIKVRDHVGGYKVGLALLMAEGPTALEEIVALGLPVFADAKLHDIPNTVWQASVRLSELGVRWITVHSSGGAEMIEAAVDGMGTSTNESGVLAVTVLTSFDDGDLAAVGLNRKVRDHAVDMALLAAASHAEGVVCSPHEATFDQISRSRAQGGDARYPTGAIRGPRSKTSDDRSWRTEGRRRPAGRRTGHHGLG